MSPLMKKVEKAGREGITRKRNPAKIGADDFFDETDHLRLSFSKLIDCDQPNRTVLIPSASYGLANVAYNLPFNDGKIILAHEQFPSNVYPWLALQEKGMTVENVSAPDSQQRGDAWNNEILNAIDNKTRVVAIGHIHWSDGTLFQLKKIREKLDAVGGLLIIDGTQSVGALPFSIKNIQPDALICAGYKWLMGPYSIGLAYYGPAFDQGRPVEENWINRLDSNNFSALVNYQNDYREQALRYEVGEHSNFILVPMLKKAIDQINKWNPQNIQDYTKHLMSDAIEQMKEWGYLIEDEQSRASHLFGARLPKKVSPDMLKNVLKKHRVSISFRGDAIRISPHVYNDEMDVRKLLKAMKEPIFA
ncbi:aminotransferase class V-fold PLP-dependent enzyme [Ekhidna sp.]|uniref:aminotransferase class V-fold PLP-dependent enzyme n=1 Tax=Ekhidna sp. TaxID=2608089 RepID=UPI003B5052DD